MIVFSVVLNNLPRISCMEKTVRGAIRGTDMVQHISTPD